MPSIELRSDTFTRPTPAMRKAIMEAEVGDDVFGEDPTINRLQERVAAMLGHEFGLFVASGTMGNQVSIAAHTRPGDEIILDSDAHIWYYEAGAPALLSGVQLRPVTGERGILTAAAIEKALRPPDLHFPPTRLICLENTLNRAGGRVFPLEEIERIRKLADRHGLLMHLDGARLWNASVATGIPLETYASFFDSVTVCFSKGLGAPVGSAIVGSKDFIERARRFRKVFGGGMRQAGILAAAALHALDVHLPLIHRDHERARRLAAAVADLPGIFIEMDSVETNIVMVEVKRSDLTATAAAEALKSEGVLLLALGPAKLRLVTHLEVTDDDIDRTIMAFRKVFSNR